MTCRDCRWFKPFDSDYDRDDPDELGLCEWPADRLPWSLRYGNRERTAVSPLDGKGCVGFEGEVK